MQCNATQRRAGADEQTLRRSPVEKTHTDEVVDETLATSQRHHRACMVVDLWLSVRAENFRRWTRDRPDYYYTRTQATNWVGNWGDSRHGVLRADSRTHTHTPPIHDAHASSINSSVVQTADTHNICRCSHCTYGHGPALHQNPTLPTVF